MGGAAFRFSPSGRFACGSKTVGGELGVGGTFIGGSADEALTIEEQFTSSSVRYLRIATSHYREIIAGGLCADDLNLPVREQSEQAFRKVEEILKTEQMNFGDIVRQWNYLERITDITHGNQCYQDFNDVRTCFMLLRHGNQAIRQQRGLAHNMEAY